ncbi:37S ribosomal protein S24, mitochondrial [Conoideocrella luteorostrata]|uniref:37S ribosomal protein S24, mitochondrial n=1 Tax=Conoideocrella luteorostrata TaxID=1105319 RepID=A0AAJ0CWP2_9HYPO|nr:37S ribosomal protein S24, mitochondrial [Conoideocrella luteorostrata]
MASASPAARLCALVCRRSPQAQRLPRTQQLSRQGRAAQRAFSTSPAQWADDRADKKGDTEAPQTLDLKTMNQAFAQSATPDGLRQLDELAKTNGYNTIDEFLTSKLRETPGWSSEDRSLEEELLKDDVGDKPNKSSFWFDEEDPETNTEEHDEFDEDDITSMAHGKLEEVREMRHYARLAAWEMPLLAKFAKPFVPPKEDEVLRWRYTTYMGESHPAERKVVVQFAPSDLKLTTVQTEKLKKLAGPRYNPETEIIKMSCESYEHQAQNKLYLTNLVDDLIVAAKDPKDTFEDVPLDLRHHQIKEKPRFPKEWRMTKERRLELEEQRKVAALEDLKRAEGGLLVDGKKSIDGYLLERLIEEQEKQRVAEMVPVQKGGGKGARR